MGFLLIPGAGVGFFLASWILMIFWGIVAPDIGIPTIGYVKSMLVTIAVWLVIAPLLSASIKGRWRKF